MRLLGIAAQGEPRQEVINERKEWQEMDVPVDAPWLPTVEEKVKRGRELVRKEWGEKADQEMAATITHEYLPRAAAMVDGITTGRSGHARR